MDVKLIAVRLRNLRGDKTRKEVCKATGIKLTALANYENGLRKPNDEAKMALANYYRVSIDELFYCSALHAE